MYAFIYIPIGSISEYTPLSLSQRSFQYAHQFPFNQCLRWDRLFCIYRKLHTLSCRRDATVTALFSDMFLFMATLATLKDAISPSQVIDFPSTARTSILLLFAHVQTADVNAEDKALILCWVMCPVTRDLAKSCLMRCDSTATTGQRTPKPAKRGQWKPLHLGASPIYILEYTAGMIPECLRGFLGE